MIQDLLPEILAFFGVTKIPLWASALVSISNLLLILALVWVLRALLMGLIGAFTGKLKARSNSAEDSRRIETLHRVFRYILTVVVGIMSVMLVLSEFGISIAPLLAGAGVAGLAIGFGAQSLVKDFFTGFVLLIENQIRSGDAVEIAGKVGIVEEVTLRHVRLRDYEGAVHFVPNGVIDTVTNRSRGFAYAVMDIGVGYGEDLDRVYRLMNEVADDMRDDPAFGPKIVAPLDIAGVEQWADSAVVIRCRLQVVALEQWSVRRHYLQKLKAAFDREKIEIPFPHRKMVFEGALPAGASASSPAPSAPASPAPAESR